MAQDNIADEEQPTENADQTPLSSTNSAPPPSSPVPPTQTTPTRELLKEYWGCLGWFVGALATIATIISILPFFGITSWQQLWENLSLIIGGVLVILALGACISLLFHKNTPKTTRRNAQIGVGLILLGGLITAFIVFKPSDSNNVKILVARFYNFDQREDTLNNVTNEVIRNLNNALSPFSDVELEPLGKAITEENGGSEAAKKLFQEKQADIVIWGSYEEKSDGKWLNSHFDVMTSTGKLKYMPTLGKEAQGEVRLLPAEMKSFTLTLKLAQEMTYLSLFTVGMARLSAKDWDGAIFGFTDALNQTTEDVPALSKGVVYNYRGRAYGMSGNYDLAIQDYNKAIELNPKYALAYTNRGFAYGRQGNYDLAIQDYNKAIELNPKYALAYTNRGFAYGRQGNFDLAIQNYTKAIELDPNAAAAYYNRGLAYYDKDNYDRAIQNYDEAIELDPNAAAAYYNRGVAYEKKGNYDRAIQDFTKSIELDPKLAKAYYNRGLAYGKKGNFDLAIQNYTKAIEFDPKFAAAYANRGNAYDDKGEYDRAILDYTKAIELDPKFAAAYTNRGVAYDDKGNSDLAIQDYTKAIEFDPKFAAAYANRGLAYAKNGDKAKAIADYREALKLTNDPSMQQDLEKRLRDLEAQP